jgi:hypothetical protein
MRCRHGERIFACGNRCSAFGNSYLLHMVLLSGMKAACGEIQHIGVHRTSQLVIKVAEDHVDEDAFRRVHFESRVEFNASCKTLARSSFHQSTAETTHEVLVPFLKRILVFLVERAIRPAQPHGNTVDVSHPVSSSWSKDCNCG